MSEEKLKPLKWTPDPSVGYQVQRRPDGGMNVVFQNVDLPTLQHWRGFALEHLLYSDRLTRNLSRDEWLQFVGDRVPYRKTCPNRP